jgi:hypothetical protein
METFSVGGERSSTMGRQDYNELARELNPDPVERVRVKKPKKINRADALGFHRGRANPPKSISESSISLFRFFRDAVKERFPKSKWPSDDRLGACYREAQEVLQLLEDSSSLDDDTIRAWVKWYVADLHPINAENKFVHLSGLKKSWKKFGRFIPGAKTQESAQEEPVESPSSVPETWIVEDMDDIFEGASSPEKISSACRSFGLILTGAYLRKLLGDEAAASEALRMALKRIAKNERIVTTIYGATCIYEIGPAGTKETFLSEWETEYHYLWEPFKCIRRDADASRANAVTGFFKAMGR